MDDVIESIRAREILSGTGRPAVEVELETAGGVRVRASAGSRTSTGRYEARELRDGGERFGGLGVRRAVENVNRVIAPRLLGHGLADQASLDRTLRDLDGTEDKSRLGGNAILPVSVAAARAGAEAAGQALFRRLGGPARKGRDERPGPAAPRLPVPLATVLAGGRHAPSPLDFEDYMLVVDGFGRYGDALEALVRTRWELGRIVEARFGPVPDVGGALSPPIRETAEALDLMLEAAETAGAAGGVRLGLDCEASDLRDEEEGRYRVAGRVRDVAALVGHYADLAAAYPLVFIEDPFDQDDFEGFAALTAALPGEWVVGDDLFASQPERIRRGIECRAANAVLLKPNQVGTVTEVCEAGRLAARGGWGVAVSIRSSDTGDPFIADLAVGLGAGWIKLGSPVRGERNAKYNRLLRIEEELGPDAALASAP